MKRNYKQSLIAAGIVFGLLVLYFTAVYAFLFAPAFSRQAKEYTQEQLIEHYGSESNYERNKADREWFLSCSPELIEVTSYDGLKLSAYFLPAEDSEHAKGAVLLIHGYHSGPLREYASMSRFFHEQGYHVCLPYQRTHGKSEGDYITFGIKERYDCKTWIDELDTRFDSNLPFFVLGISMGSATAVMAAGFELPANLRGIIADCGFTRPRDMIYHELVTAYHFGSPIAHTITNTADLLTRLFAGFSLDDYSTFEALKNNWKPILFIHGTADKRIPFYQSISNYEYAHEPKELFLAEGATHAMSFYVQEEAYKKTVLAFFERYGAK